MTTTMWHLIARKMQSLCQSHRIWWIFPRGDPIPKIIALAMAVHRIVISNILVEWRGALHVLVVRVEPWNSACSIECIKRLCYSFRILFLVLTPTIVVHNYEEFTKRNTGKRHQFLFPWKKKNCKFEQCHSKQQNWQGKVYFTTKWCKKERPRILSLQTYWS